MESLNFHANLDAAFMLQAEGHRVSRRCVVTSPSHDFTARVHHHHSRPSPMSSSARIVIVLSV